MTAATSLLVSASGLVLPAAPASATTCGTFTWTGLDAVLNTNWSDRLNWQGGTAPTANSCVSLTFPFTAAHTGATNNDLSNLEINTLDITGQYTLTGGPSSAVSMVDSTTTPAGVTDSANSTIQLSLNLVNNTTFAVASGNSLTLSGVISDAPAPNNPLTGITASGPGTLILSNGNTSYTGNTQVNGGTLELTNTSALGIPANTVTVGPAAILQLGPSATSPFIIPQRVTLAGLVVGGGSDQRLTGLLTLADTGGSLASNGLLTVNKVSGNGALTITAGTVKLAGSNNNTYGGGTVVAGGTLHLDVVPGAGAGLATPGLLSVDSGAAVTLDAPGQLDASSTGGLTLVGTGSANLNGNNSTVANLTLDSTSGSGAPTVTDSAVMQGTLSVTSKIVSEGTGLPAVISAPLDLAPSGAPVSVQTIDSLVVSRPLSGGALMVTAPSPSFGLCSSGTSTSPCVAMVVSGASAGYSGPVTVTSGVLDVTGTMSTAPVTVGSNGVLTGNGAVGGVISSGTLSPGTTVAYQAGSNLTDADSPGVLSVSSLTLSGGTMNVRLDGTSAGSGGTTCSGYDQIKVANGGNAALGMGTTTLDVFSDKHSNGVPCRTPLNGEPYTIISSPSTTGTFNGYAQGAAVTDTQTPYQYTISYTGNVVLTANNNSTVVVALTSTGGSSPSNPSIYGQQLTFNATVSGPSGTPTGTVTFSDTNTTGGNTVNFPIACQQTGTATVTLSAGLAPCTPAGALPGDPNPGDTNTFTATYSGNSTYGGNTGSAGQVVNTQPTTTAISSGNPSTSTYGQQVTFTATITRIPASGTQASTVSPNGTVTFSVTNNSNTSALLDCSGKSVLTSNGTTTATCQTTQLPTGTDTVTAAYTGDGNYGSSATSSGASQTVNKASTTTTLSSGTPDPSVFGQAVTFTATVTPTTAGPNPPGGSVTFSANGNALTDCPGTVSTPSGTTTASCTTSKLPVGNPVSVTAVYNGDTNYVSSPTSNTVNQTVNQGSTSTGLVSSPPSSSAAGQPVTYTATVTVLSPGVGTPTGTVTFTDGGNAVNCGTGTQPLNPSGQATCPVTYGIAGPPDHSITATYSGDTNFAGSASSALPHQVVPGATTTALSQGSPSTSAYGQQVTFTATINHTFTAAFSPGGTVTFSAGGNALADCSAAPVSTSAGSTTATCQTVDLPTGNAVSVKATYNGDTNYAVSTSSAQSQTVNPASTTTTIAAGSPNPSVFGQPVSFTATVTPSTTGPLSPSGSVAFQSGGNALDCSPVMVSTSSGTTTATCTTAALPKGTDGVTATYNGDSANYAASAASNSVNQTVNQAATTVNVTGSPNPAAAGQAVTLTATVAAAPPGGGTPTGTVEFFDPGNPIPGCTSQPLSSSGGRTTATCTVPFNSIGDRSVSATYSGDGNFTGSNSSSITQKVVHSVRPAGYWMVASDGGIFSFGPGAHFYGSTGAQHLNAPIVGMAEDPATGGYWLVASDGGIFAFNAPFFGSTGSQHLNAPIVGMAAAPDGNGYWLVASDGGIFSFGPSAHFYGSTGAIHLNQPIVGMAAAPDGNGYWLVASDGGIFSFGPSATFFGSTGSTPLNRPMVGMAASPDGNGYWLVASDGGIFAFGPSAQFFGSAGNINLNRPIVGMAAAPDGNGYWLVASDGGIFAFGPSAGFYGSTGATRLNQPVVGMAAAG